LRIYETFGAKVHPDVLLVGLFLGNDFSDAAMFDRWLKSGASSFLRWKIRPLHFSLRHPLHGIKDLLRRYSYLYNLVHEIISAYGEGRSSERRPLVLANGHRLVLYPTYLAEAVTLSQPDREEFQLVFQAIVCLSSLAKQARTEMLVIFQPSGEETYLPLLGESVPDLGGPLRLALEKEGISCLDLTPSFRRRAMAGDQLFFAVDGHPNELGHRLIAEEILARLQADPRFSRHPSCTLDLSSTRFKDIGLGTASPLFHSRGAKITE
jgi:hypothetical protein